MPDLRTRLFHAWFRWSRPMTLGVRGLVEDGEGRICLVRHTYVRGWHLPGGGVEQHETARTALARELGEEAGVRLTGAICLFGVYSNHPGFRNDHVLLYRIGAADWKAMTPRSTGEIAERMWTRPDTLPESITSGTRARIEEVYSGRRISDYWASDTE
jgi:ADP-ribose pyrophosphatase YjhB (NUDIX family)